MKFIVCKFCSPMQKKLFLKKGGVLIGTLEYKTVDQPFFYYKFLPTKAFDEYKKIFHEEAKLLESKDDKGWGNLYDTIQSLGFHLESENATINEFLLHIDKTNTAWLRY